MLPHTFVKETSLIPLLGHILAARLTPGDSKLKKMVLNKTLFFPTCPHCREELKLRPRCMYINNTKEDLFIVTDDPEETVFETILTSGDIRFSNIHTDDGKLQAAAPEDLQKYRGDVIVHYVGKMSVYY